MKRPLASLTLASTLALAACGGGGGGISSTPPPRQTAPARITISIPNISPSAHARKPAYVSPATKSVSLSGPGFATATVALVPGTPQCTQTSSALVCTVELPVPVGTTTVTVSTFASTDGSGTPLSTQNVSVTVVSGTVTVVNLTLNPVVSALAVAVNPSTLGAGIPSSATVSVNALDAAGKTIVGPGTFVDAAGNPLTVTLADSDASGATHLSQTTLTAPSASIALTYNGASIGNFTISASAPGVTTATATVTVNPSTQTVYVALQNQACSVNVSQAGSVGSYQILATGGVGPSISSLTVPDIAAWVSVGRHGDLFSIRQGRNGAPSAILRYPAPGTGTPPPAATISGAATGLDLPVEVAADSSGGVWVANGGGNGHAAGLLHFAAGADGNVAPDRLISGITGTPPELTFDTQAVAVDSHDNVYTIEEQLYGTQARVYELAAGSSGVASPIASYGFDKATGILGHLSIDQHNDNVWVSPTNVYSGGAAAPPSPGAMPIDTSGLEGYTPGSTAPFRVLYGNSSFPNLTVPPVVVSVAFDGQDNVYAQYYYSKGGICPTNARVSTFSASQNGNVMPLQVDDLGSTIPIGIVIPVFTTPPSGGSSGGSPSNAVVATPTSLSFLATGPSYARALSVAETGYGNSFRASSGNTAVVTVTADATGHTFTVTPVGAGTTSITAADGSGNYTTVVVAVSITGFNLQSRRHG